METMNAFASVYPLEILVADNDPADRAATSHLLTQLGYKPDEATSVRDFFVMADAKQYDVVLMDVHIPGVEGVLDTSDRQPGLKPLFIAVTGATSRNFKTTTLVTRMDSYITRPMDHHELSLQLQACSVLAGKCCIRLT